MKNLLWLSNLVFRRWCCQSKLVLKWLREWNDKSKQAQSAAQEESVAWDIMISLSSINRPISLDKLPGYCLSSWWYQKLIGLWYNSYNLYAVHSDFSREGVANMSVRLIRVARWHGCQWPRGRNTYPSKVWLSWLDIGVFCTILVKMSHKESFWLLGRCAKVFGTARGVSLTAACLWFLINHCTGTGVRLPNFTPCLLSQLVRINAFSPDFVRILQNCAIAHTLEWTFLRTMLTLENFALSLRLRVDHGKIWRYILMFFSQSNG